MTSVELFNSEWALSDTLANLAADSRTRGIPVFVYGPLAVQYKHPNLERNYPGVKLLVQPVSADILLQQLKTPPGVLTQAIHTDYAREAAKLFARIATECKGPFFADLRSAEPALAVALNNGQMAADAATTLREVSDPDAQRSLADVALDPSKTPVIRKQSTIELVRSIQRIGPLITASQEAKLLTSIREEANPEIRASLLTVLHALTPVPPRKVPDPPRSSVLPASSGAVSTPPKYGN
jgi:hypothetical protein